MPGRGSAPRGWPSQALARTRQVCKKWEAAAAGAAPLGARVVLLRMGIVLDRGGGALAKMAPVFQACGGPGGVLPHARTCGVLVPLSHARTRGLLLVSHARTCGV